MAISQEQLQKRKNYIGSSDCAKIMMGVDYPWRKDGFSNPLVDLWLEKTGQLDDWVPPTHTQKRFDLGHMLEGPILERFMEPRLKHFCKYEAQAVHENGVSISHIDMLAQDDGGRNLYGVEAKTSGIMPLGPTEGWGIERNEDGSINKMACTDEVPDYVGWQCQHHMACHNLYVVYVPAILAFNGLAPYQVDDLLEYGNAFTSMCRTVNHLLDQMILYKIKRDQKAIDALLDAEERFWHNYVELKVRPKGIPSLECVKRMRKKPGITKIIDPLFISNYRLARKDRDEATERCKMHQSLLLAELLPCQYGDFGEDKPAIAYPFRVPKRKDES